MGRGIQAPSQYNQMGGQYGQMGDRFNSAMDQFRQDHPFPTNAGFPGIPGGPQTPPTPLPPVMPSHPMGGGGEISGGGMPNTQHPLNPAAGGEFPGGGGFPGGGATGGTFPGYPRGSTGNTVGRVGYGWGPIAGRNESGPGNALSKSFSATGSSGANRPGGSNQ